MCRTMVVAEPIEDVARALAAAHARDSHDDLQVFWQRTRDDTIRLVEVSARFFPSPERDRVRALWFAPGSLHGVPYRTEVALATEAEWKAALCGEVSVGADWPVASFVRIWPA